MAKGNHTTTRSCDALGVFQGHEAPCNDCTSAVNPHRLHRVVSLESAGQCSRGCDMCPSPQACELAEDDAPIYTPLSAAAELAGSALIVLACVAAAVFLVKTGFGA